MQVDPDSALKGVRTRLVGALAAAAVTLVCFMYAMLSSLSSFGGTFALTIGVCSFGAAVALLLSARHEEEVHELASSFEREDLRSLEQLGEAPEAAPALPEPQFTDELWFDSYEPGEREPVAASRRELRAGQTDGAI